ncbi:MAG: PAS domain S-box protein [Betaproteobacteria bacterium]
MSTDPASITRDFRHADAWVGALLFAVGAGAVALAGASLAGYHHGPAVLRIAEKPVLQYDIAWIVGLYGLALALYAVHARGLAHFSAAVGATIGLLGIIAFVFPASLTRNPLLDNPWLENAAGYARIGVVNALVALILGMALFLLVPRANRSPSRSVALAALASIAAALALLNAFGAWSGSVFAAQSLQFAGDEYVSAPALLMLALTVLAYALVGRQEERVALWRATPIIVWLAAIACALVVWRAALVQEARFIRHGTELVASAAAIEVKRAVEARIDVLRRLSDRVLIHNFTAEIWQLDAGSLLKDVDEFRTIAWSGPDYVVRWVAPPVNTIGYNIRENPERVAAIDLARQTREPTISRFADLSIGGSGAIVYVPTFQGDTYVGMVSGSLARADWLAQLIDGRYPDHYFELLEDAVVVQSMALPAPKATAEWSQDVPVAVRNARWTLRVTPTQAYVTQARSALPEAGLLLGAALATLLALATFLFQEARLRARETANANLRLSADVARRQRVEQSLREAENRTQLIINSVKDCAIYMLDTEGRVATWNPGARLLNGYDSDEILGRSFSVLYPPDRDVPPESELIVATRRGWFEEECWHQRKDGSRYCGDDIISAIRDEQGGLRGFAVVTRDATPRIQLRDQTERARDYYLSLFSSFPNLVWRSDAQGRCEYVNQAWLDYTGVPLEDSRGEGWLENVHPDDRELWSDTIARGFPTRQSFEFEFRMRRADNEYGSIICSGRPYHDLEGNFAGYLCSCYDNTARRNTENALKESEERYQRMTTNVPGMVFKLERGADGKFRFLYVSQGALVVTGEEPATLTGDIDTFLALLEPADRASVLVTLDDSAARLSTLNWAGRLRPRHETTERWITIRARPRIAESGSTLWDGVVFDDSQARLAQVELERSREELRALSSHLQTIREEEKAHIAREVHDELGSTLTGLRIDLDWLMDRADQVPAPARKKYEGMLTLVQAATAATRRIVTELRPSILDDLGLASALRWQAGEYQKHSELRFHLQMPDPEISVDRDSALALFRIFQETITNVAKYAKATEVDVILAQTDDALVMQIHDNGVGVDPGDLVKSTSHGIRGMRERAQALGGTVRVTGAPGEGTQVIVSLPRPGPASGART